MLLKQPFNTRHREQFPTGALLSISFRVRSAVQEPESALRAHNDRAVAAEPAVPTQTAEGTASPTNSSSQYY
jgi:hypothetical protein